MMITSTMMKSMNMTIKNQTITLMATVKNQMIIMITIYLHLHILPHYHQHRPLLSGWKGNPSLPKGLIYQGVSEEPIQYSGGSAAQSASLQLLDAGLGVVHHGEEGEFLTRMRDEYMPPNQVHIAPLLLSSGT